MSKCPNGHMLKCSMPNATEVNATCHMPRYQMVQFNGTCQLCFALRCSGVRVNLSCCAVHIQPNTTQRNPTQHNATWVLTLCFVFVSVCIFCSHFSIPTMTMTGGRGGAQEGGGMVCSRERPSVECRWLSEGWCAWSREAGHPMQVLR